MDTEIVRAEPQQQDIILTPVMNIAKAKERLAEFQEFVKDYLVEGEDQDYGHIKGVKKKLLFKPGADKLCELYGMSDEYEVSHNSQENWSMDPPLFDYTVKCILRSKRSGVLVSTGLGSCNSYEGKYRWRDAKPACPHCGGETIYKDKNPPHGYYCWSKMGGCGAKFRPDDEAITGQKIGKVLNDDIATLKNTILKMAKKRAKIDATLSATRSSGIFTQDVEDFPESKSEPQHKANGAPETQPTRAATQEAQHDDPEPPLPGTGNTISEKQVKRLWAIARNAGWTDSNIKSELEARFHLKSSKEIEKGEQYEFICQYFEGGGKPPDPSVSESPF